MHLPPPLDRRRRHAPPPSALTTTSPASQHPTEYPPLDRPQPATGIVHAHALPYVDVIRLSSLRQAISIAATAMAWDPSHLLTDVVTRFSTPTHAEAWAQAEQEIDDSLANYPATDDPPTSPSCDTG